MLQYDAAFLVPYPNYCDIMPLVDFLARKNAYIELFSPLECWGFEIIFIFMQGLKFIKKYVLY